MQTLFISDVTLRQAQKRADAALSFKERLGIAKSLDRLRLWGVELPPIASEKVDALLFKSIAMVVRHSRLVLPAALTKEGVDAAWGAIREAAHPCIQIAVPVSAVQMEYQCHKKPDQILALIQTLVAYAKSLCPEVEFAADDATRSEPAFLHRAIEAAVAAGADAVTLCDTAGRMLPDEFAGFLRDAYAAVPALSERVLGVWCADELSLAAACAVGAVSAGARLFKASVCERGVLPLPAFSEILRARGADMNVTADMRTTELVRIAKQIDWMTHSKKSELSPFDSGVRSASAFGGVLDETSTLHELAEAVQKLGYDLSEEDTGKVFEAFKPIAAKKKVGEKELEAIIASAALQVPPTYAVESYVVNSGNVITATAHIKLKKQDGTLQGIALGDGPIDAAFLAIEQIVGHHYELDDFQIQAVTEGREAMGSTLVRLRSGGRLYSGKGISTDVIGASIRAYVNALNKIVYEEAVRP